MTLFFTIFFYKGVPDTQRIGHAMLLTFLVEESPPPPLLFVVRVRIFILVDCLDTYTIWQYASAALWWVKVGILLEDEVAEFFRSGGRIECCHTFTFPLMCWK